MDITDVGRWVRSEVLGWGLLIVVGERAQALFGDGIRPWVLMSVESADVVEMGPWLARPATLDPLVEWEHDPRT